jgi:hypothetical protein
MGVVSKVLRKNEKTPPLPQGTTFVALPPW